MCSAMGKFYRRNPKFENRNSYQRLPPGLIDDAEAYAEILRAPPRRGLRMTTLSLLGGAEFSILRGDYSTRELRLKARANNTRDTRRQSQANQSPKRT